ncbi:hypothetical protein Csa_021152 [Cucumis sativus]|nr:hypothetical protein Csa_021152 [Cucumis sativus]
MIGCNTIREISLTLEQTYSKSNTTKIMQLKEQLWNLKKGSHSIKDYTTKVKNLALALNEKQFTGNTPLGMPSPDQAYMASSSQDNNINGWYGKTGATTHITNDLANFNFSTIYSAHVGDRTSLKILNSGHSFFISFDISISFDNHCPILSIPNSKEGVQRWIDLLGFYGYRYDLKPFHYIQMMNN